MPNSKARAIITTQLHYKLSWVAFIAQKKEWLPLGILIGKLMVLTLYEAPSCCIREMFSTLINQYCVKLYLYLLYRRNQNFAVLTTCRALLHMRANVDTSSGRMYSDIRYQMSRGYSTPSSSPPSLAVFLRRRECLFTITATTLRSNDRLIFIARSCCLYTLHIQCCILNLSDIPCSVPTFRSHIHKVSWFLILSTFIHFLLNFYCL